MLDAVELERRGVPSVTVVTEPFVPAAEAARRALGLDDLPLIVIPHDYLDETPSAVDQKVALVVDELFDQLLGPD